MASSFISLLQLVRCSFDLYTHQPLNDTASLGAKDKHSFNNYRRQKTPLNYRDVEFKYYKVQTLTLLQKEVFDCFSSTNVQVVKRNL